MIDPKEKISNHFTNKEALWLPQWNRMANEQDGLNDDVLSSLKDLFSKMDLVREYFNAPIMVHVTYRPEEYNKLVKGAKNSAHKFGMACDFHVSKMACKDAIQKMLDDKKLEEWGMRCENNGDNPTWIHLDIRDVPPGGNRYFKP